MLKLPWVFRGINTEANSALPNAELNISAVKISPNLCQEHGGSSKEVSLTKYGELKVWVTLTD